MMSKLLRRVTTMNRDTIFLWTNQVRDKIGTYAGGTTTPGGRALRFYASTRIELKRGEREKAERMIVKKGKQVKSPVTVGRWVLVRSEKEKTARPEMQSMFLFDIEHGRIDREEEIIHLGLEDELIERRGNTYEYEDSNGDFWSGTRSVFKRLLAEEEDMKEELEWAISERTKELSAPKDDDG
jgi:recombination protein RecA